MTHAQLRDGIFVLLCYTICVLLIGEDVINYVIWGIE